MLHLPFSDLPLKKCPTFGEGGNGKGGIRICLPVHRLTGSHTVTQMRHPLFIDGRPNCARQSLASTLSTPHVAVTWHCDPGRHANVITPCLLAPCLNVRKLYHPPCRFDADLEKKNSIFLVSHYSAIGDVISCDASISAIGFRGKLFLRYPHSKACLWIAIGGHFLQREVGV